MVYSHNPLLAGKTTILDLRYQQTPSKMPTIHLYQFGVYQAESGCGVREYLYQLAQLLKDQVHIHFINFALEDAQDYQVVKEEENIDVHLFGKMHLKGWYLPNTFYRWLDELPSQENSIFHLHSMFNLANYHLAQSLHKRNIPYVFTPHDSYSPESLRKNYLLKLFFLKTLEKRLLDQAKLIHAITEEGAEYIQRYSHNQVMTVTNFVNDYAPTQHTPDPKKYICFVGRFDIYQKGIDLQIKALRSFYDKTSSRFPLYMLGNASEQKQRQVRQLCNQAGLEIGQDVILTGKVSDEDKHQYLSEAYVYMQLSRYEGFGLSIVEALSFSKPIIITDKVPIHEQVSAYGAGFVVRHVEEAREALQEIYRMSPEAYQEMSQNARLCYEENYHPKLIKSGFISMFKQVLPVQV